MQSRGWHNLTVKFTYLLAASLCLCGCAKDINSKDAVKAAIEKRVSKTFDLTKMTVNVTNVSFHDKEAEATVAFVPIGGPAGGGATFSYELKRQGDEWVATGLKQGSMSGHAGAAPAPTQGMPGDLPGGGMPGSLQGGAPATGTLPPGHPAVGK
jgi:hypothetical protein